MAKIIVQQPGRVLDILRRQLPGWKGSTLKQRLRHGLILLNGQPAPTGAAELAAGDTVEILDKPVLSSAILPPGSGEPPLEILHFDDSLLAVNKPSGLLSVASEREKNLTAVRLLREWLAETDAEAARNLHAAHRLDRDASGVLLLARSLDVKRRLAKEWYDFEKTYLAVVDGVPPEAEAMVDAPLWEDKGLFVRVAETGRGEEARTHYRLMRTNGARSLLEVRLDTGRKHQIRVHLAHIGCPIVGDLRYGVSKAPRLMLHAWRLRLNHPVGGDKVLVTAPEPAMFKKILARRKETR